MKELESSQLFNPQLNLVSPSLPQFWKHDRENAAFYSTYGVREAAKSPKKLLPSDYDWLGAPPGLDPVASVRDSAQTGPAALQNTRYMARARTALAKLQQQVRECVERALEEQAANSKPTDALTHDAHTDHTMPGALAGTQTRPSLYSSVRPAVVSPYKKPAEFGSEGLVPSDPSQRPEPTDALPTPFLLPADSLRVKMQAMFEDCMSDIMDQLWAAMQHAGSAHEKVDVLKQAMVQRDSEIEAVALKRAKALESQLGELKTKLQAAAEATEAETARNRSLALAHSTQGAQLAQVNSRLQAMTSERDKALQDMDTLRTAHAEAIRALDAQHKAESADQARRIQDLTQQLHAAHEQLHARDAELEKAHTRLGEQIAMLEVAFERRDLEIEKCKELTRTVEEVVSWVAKQGPEPAGQWVQEVEANSGPEPYNPGELVEGPYGVAKAVLHTAKSMGLSLMLKAVKTVLPDQLPRHQGTVQEADASEDRPRPRITMLSAEYDPAILPDSWVRFLNAPLAEQLPAKELCRHIHELYTMKDSADSAAQAAGLPAPSLHTAIYRCCLVRHPTPDMAERDIIRLIQSVRAHMLTVPRVHTFSLFLGLQRPGLPANALNVYLAYRRALRAVSPNAPAPTCVEEEEGAVTWVHPTKWRAVLAGPLARHADAATAKAVMRGVSELKIQSARSQRSFGMTDMDCMLELVMMGWAAYIQTAGPAHLKSVYEQHDSSMSGVFEFEEFKAVLGSANPALTFDDLKTLDLLHRCLENTAKEARAPNAVVKGSISLPAFIKTCLDQGVVGSLAVPASTLDINRLSTAAELLNDYREGIQSDIQTNNVQVEGMSELQGSLTALLSRVRSAQGLEPVDTTPKPALASAPPAVPPVLDGDVLTTLWTGLTGLGQQLAQAHRQVQALAAEKRKMLSEAAAAREASLRQQIDSAQQTVQAVIAEKKAAEQTAIKLQAQVATLEAAMAEALSALDQAGCRSVADANAEQTPRKTIDFSVGWGDVPGEASEFAASQSARSRRATSVSQADALSSAHASQGGTLDSEGSLVAPEDRHRAELAKLQKRATDAEARYAANRAQLLEVTATLEKVQDKLNKRKVSEEKAAAAKLLSGLTKLFGRLNLGVAGTGNPTPHCLQLMEILGTLQGLSVSLEAAAVQWQDFTQRPPARVGFATTPHSRRTSHDSRRVSGQDDPFSPSQRNSDNGNATNPSRLHRVITSNDGRSPVWPSLSQAGPSRRAPSVRLKHALTVAVPGTDSPPENTSPTQSAFLASRPSEASIGSHGHSPSRAPIPRPKSARSPSVSQVPAAAQPPLHPSSPSKSKSFGALGGGGGGGGVGGKKGDVTVSRASTGKLKKRVSQLPTSPSMAHTHRTTSEDEEDMGPEPGDFSRVLSQAVQEAKDDAQRRYVMAVSTGLASGRAAGEPGQSSGQMEGRSPRDSAHDTTDAPNAVPDGAPGQGMGCGDSTDAVVCVRAAMACVADVIQLAQRIDDETQVALTDRAKYVSYMEARVREAETALAAMQERLAELEAAAATAAHAASSSRPSYSGSVASAAALSGRPSLRDAQTSTTHSFARRSSIHMAGDTAGMGMHAAAGVQGALPPWLLRQQKSYREAQRQGPVLAVTNIGMQEDGPEGSDTEHQDRLTQLLVHGVAMAGGDFDALAHAVLSIVQSAGGFPLVKEDGSIVRAVGGDVLVPAAGTEPGVPDIAAQCDVLGHLYVSCAGALLAQHVKLARLTAHESNLTTLLTDLSENADTLVPHQAARSDGTAGKVPAGVDRQLELLTSSLSTLHKQVAHYKDILAHAQQGSNATHPTHTHPPRHPDPTHTPDQTSSTHTTHIGGQTSGAPADNARSTNTNETVISNQGSTEGVQGQQSWATEAQGLISALQEELSLADVTLADVKRRLAPGARSDSPEDEPMGDVATHQCGDAGRNLGQGINGNVATHQCEEGAGQMVVSKGSVGDVVAARRQALLVSILEQLARDAEAMSTPASEAITRLLDLHPSQLYSGLYTDKETETDPVTDGYKSKDARERDQPVYRVALREYPDLPTPPASPRVQQDSTDNTTQGEDTCALPPGEAPVLLSPSLLQRSALGSPRYRLVEAGRRPASANTLDMSASEAHMAVPERPYERRPYTARRYMETLVHQNTMLQGPPYNVWPTADGAFWTGRFTARGRPDMQGQGGPTAHNRDGHHMQDGDTQDPLNYVAGPWPWWHPAVRAAAQMPRARSASKSPHNHPTSQPTQAAPTHTNPTDNRTSPSQARASQSQGQHSPSRRTTSPGRVLPLISMSAVVAGGQAVAAQARLRLMSQSPELAGWSDAPSQVAGLSAAAVASGALANGGPQGGLRRPQHRMRDLAGPSAPGLPALFAGKRADAAGTMTDRP